MKSEAGNLREGKSGQQVKQETVSLPGGYTDPFPGSILGISIPAVAQSTSQLSVSKSTALEHATSSSRMAHYMSSQLPHKSSTHDLAPPSASLVARGSSASSRASESPGPFSRTSTPTSISSHSPGVALPPKFASRIKPPMTSAQSRPPVTRHKIGGNVLQINQPSLRGLPVLRESTTSSSSSSTIKAIERVESPETASIRQDERLGLPYSTNPLRYSANRLPLSRTIVSTSSTEDISEKTVEPPSYHRSAALSKCLAPAPQAVIQGESQRNPPPRPSRVGAHSIDDEPSPIIQSNLSKLMTTGHKRRESIETATVSPIRNKVQTSTRLPIASTISHTPHQTRLPSKVSSLNTGKLNSEVLNTVSTTKNSVPPLQTTFPRGPPNNESNSSSDSSAKSPKKFNFFARQTKAVAESTSLSSVDKSIKKGPAAGTGHEGYGKYARRGRNGSTSSIGSRGRSPSVDSNLSRAAHPSASRRSSIASQSEPELDDFYKDRLAPVVIGGGGRILENQNSKLGLHRIESHESFASLTSGSPLAPHPPPKSHKRVYGSRSQQEKRFLSPKDTSFPESHAVNNLHLSNEVPSLQVSTKTPTLATRRSLYRSRSSKEAGSLKVLSPIDTTALASSPSLDSYDTLQSFGPGSESTNISTDDVSEGHEGNWLKPRKTLERVKLPERWNFLQKVLHSPKKSSFAIVPESSPELGRLPATVSKTPSQRCVAHYAILDEPEEESSESLEDLLHGIEEDLELRQQSDAKNNDWESRNRKQEREASLLLPPPPMIARDFSQQQRPASPKVTLHRQGNNSNTKSEPKINIPPSAPKPLVKGSRLAQVGRIPKVVSSRDRLHKPSQHSFSRPFQRKPQPAVPSTQEAPLRVDTSVGQLAQQQEADTFISNSLEKYTWTSDLNPPMTDNPQSANYSDQEFIRFSPRKGSEVSVSGSSGVLNYANMTAVLPTPDSTLSEDEIWNEYDELLDHVVSSIAVSDTSLSGHGSYKPIQSLKMRHQASSDDPRKESPIIRSPRSSGSTIIARSPRLLPLQMVMSPTVSATSPKFDVPPVSPISFSDFFAGYGDRSSAAATATRQSSSSGSRYSLYNTLSKSGSHSSRGSPNEKRYKEIMNQKSSDSYNAQNNLRFSAVMASRWLSFNRVLFSPAQEEVESNRQERILVLDGLGNDDWSSYCALTYPDAIVYNLGNLRPVSARKRESPEWKALPNHRQIHHAGIAHPFPFPRGFFAVVVLRFPIASSEPAYYNAVSESKRVLRPGGYLELSVLDIDMVNMGNRARRAVRALKTKMQDTHSQVSLSSISDIMQKMLGRRGFENLNRCVVGVPVARSISDSRSGSIDDRDMSLDEMLKDRSSLGDVPITKMVAKVGRWWWSRCYERALTDELPRDSSLWNDKALLKECVTRETGFKLLICYAQKPSNPRRRTVSV